MPTEKLYWLDPHRTAFDGAQARMGRFGERASIVLDRTLFYPEAGGQLSDRGTLTWGGREIAIDDVQIDDEGTIHHLGRAVDTLDSKGAEAAGMVDGARRRDFMAQHTAQHMISRALVDVAGADTVSARLGETTATIDVSVATLDDGAIGRAEDLVNDVIRGDVAVRAHFPSPDELARMPLRRAPKVSEGIRVIEVEGFDFSPCGGTHCTRTGQIGAVRIVGTERYKGMMRVSFHAASRALADARMKERVLAGLAAEFTCGLSDVPAAVARLRGELKERVDALATARGELAALVAEKALAANPPDSRGLTPIVLVRTGDDVGMLRTLAARLASRPDVVAFCATGDAASGDLLVVVQRGENARFDCGAWLKSTAAAAGGRGGGRPERAEGRLPRSIDLASLAIS